MEISKNSVALAGEFAVLSQLFLRGFDANLTLGKTKSVDILASYPATGRMLKLEVKTKLGNKPENSKCFGRTQSWVMTKKHETIADEHLFYCFVAVSPDTHRFAFYIVPSAVVARYVREEHQVWLCQSSLDHEARVDSDLRRFRLGLDEAGYRIDTPLAKDHENQWEILVGDA